MLSVPFFCSQAERLAAAEAKRHHEEEEVKQLRKTMVPRVRTPEPLLPVSFRLLPSLC